LLVKSNSTRIIAIIELKQTDNVNLDKSVKAEEGIKQIKQKKYLDPRIKRNDIDTVYIYGICFCQKECSVKSEKLK